MKLKDILDFSPIGIGWSNVNGKIEYVNHQFIKLFGYTLEDIPNIETWYKKAYPNEQFRKTVIDPWHEKVVLANKKNISAPELEASITCKDGSVRRVVTHVSWLGDKRLVNFNDISNAISWLITRIIANMRNITTNPKYKLYCIPSFEQIHENIKSNDDFI